MKMTKKTLALAVVAASVMVSAPAMAEVTANVGVTSNYLWRGLTQNGDDAAVQGGIDYSHASGAYVGTWASSLGDATTGTAYEGYELDLYGGYKFNVGEVALDVGAISYMYPIKDTSGVDNDDSFYEGYVGAAMGPFSAKLSYSPDVDLTSGNEISGTYVEAAYTTGLFTFHVGNYSFGEDMFDTNGDGVADEKNYMDYGVSVTKDEFTFGVSKVTVDAGNLDDARVYVSYKKSLSL